MPYLMDYFHTFSIYTEGVVFQFKVRLEWTHSIPIKAKATPFSVFNDGFWICKTDFIETLRYFYYIFYKKSDMKII